MTKPMTSPNPARDEALEAAAIALVAKGAEISQGGLHGDFAKLAPDVQVSMRALAEASVSAYRAAVDRVNRATDAEIGGIHRTFASAPAPASGVDAVARLAYGYELMHTALCHIAGTSGEDRHWYVHKAQEVTARITRVGEVTADSNPGKPGDCLRGYRQFIASLSPAATSGSETGGEHPDDLAVDRFAAAMKAKLAKKRAEGRGGWERKDECSNGFLSQLLREHIDKGDPVDVGNLAMMIHQRDETIAKPASSPAGGDVREALKPFADVADHFDNYEAEPGNHSVLCTVRLADLRRARTIVRQAALSPSTSAAEPVAWTVESLAQWLHEEAEHQESYPHHHWPEHPDDDGNRDGGFVKIVPKHAQAYFRQLAARCLGIRPFSGKYFEAIGATPPAPAAVDGQRVKVRDWLAVARAAGHPAKQTPRIPTAPCSLRREGAMSDWAQIRSAPKDGRDIEILTFGGFEMTARWESRGFINEAGEDCGAWVASEEGKHPPCWSEGACWESNEDEMPSDPPIMWRAAP